jgi:hypothetical protein
MLLSHHSEQLYCTATKEPENVSENAIQNYERATNAYVQ